MSTTTTTLTIRRRDESTDGEPGGGWGGGQEVKITAGIGRDEGRDDKEYSPATKKQRTDFVGAIANANGKRPGHQHRRGKKRGLVTETQGKTKVESTQAAPFNTTQFIMNDHGDTIQYLDQKLGVSVANSENNPSHGEPQRKRVTRARESSFSLDSDDDDFYSSPDDEGDFLSKEFLKDYDHGQGGPHQRVPSDGNED
jgi:hypothetical protein